MKVRCIKSNLESDAPFYVGFTYDLVKIKEGYVWVYDEDGLLQVADKDCFEPADEEAEKLWAPDAEPNDPRFIQITSIPPFDDLDDNGQNEGEIYGIDEDAVKKIFVMGRVFELVQGTDDYIMVDGHSWTLPYACFKELEKDVPIGELMDNIATDRTHVGGLYILEGRGRPDMVDIKNSDTGEICGGIYKRRFKPRNSAAKKLLQE